MQRSHPAAALPLDQLLHAVAAHCDAETLCALSLASRTACTAARLAATQGVTVPHLRAAELVAAISAGRLPAVRAVAFVDMVLGWPPPPALLAALPRLPTLRVLRLPRAYPGAAGFADVAACTRLEYLDLSFSDELGDGGARTIAAALTRLTALKVGYCKLTAVGAAAIATLPRLQWLFISGNPLGDAGGAALSALARLTHLEASSVGCPQLLHHLRGLMRLQELMLHDFWEDNDDDAPPDEAALDLARAHVTALTSLRGLRVLQGPPLDDGAAATLSGALIALTHLQSSGYTRMRAPGLAALGRLPLVELSLCAAHAHGAAPAGLAPLAPTLRALELRASEVDDAGAAAIARLTQLTRLMLHHNRVSRDGVAALAAGLTELRDLLLSYNPADAVDAGPLSALKALTHLQIDYRRDADEQAADAAQSALLRCTRLVSLRLTAGRVSSWVVHQLKTKLPLLEDLTDSNGFLLA